MSRRDDVERLAPVAPPCFSSRGQWVEYSQTAAEAYRPGHIEGPLLIEAGKPVRFNRHYQFCADCTAQHSFAMEQAGKCEPAYLLQLLPPDRPRDEVLQPQTVAGVA